MSLAATQQVSSAVSPSTPVNEPLFALLHVNVNYGAQKNGVCLSRWAKSIFMKETVGIAWGFNHGDTNGTPTFFRSACHIRAVSADETRAIHRNGQVENKF